MAVAPTTLTGIYAEYGFYGSEEFELWCQRYDAESAKLKGQYESGDITLKRYGKGLQQLDRECPRWDFAAGRMISKLARLGNTTHR